MPNVEQTDTFSPQSNPVSLSEGSANIVSAGRTRLDDIFLYTPAFLAILLGPDHVYDRVNEQYSRLIGYREVVGKSVAEALPEVVEQGFITLLDEVYRTGIAYVGTNTRLILQNVSDTEFEEVYLDFTYQPMFDDNGQVMGILAHGLDSTRRNRLEQEQKRLFEEHQQLLREAQSWAKREALINQIGVAARAAIEPEEVLAIAVEALGKALNVDRCYFATYDLANDFGRIDPDWQREGLRSIVGNYRLSDYVVNHYSDFQRGKTQVVTDTYRFVQIPQESPPKLSSVSLMDKLGLRALIRTPMQSEGLITALAVAMADGPRDWTDEEIRLVETIATQTRAAVESVRVQLRERNIAVQLQDALIPAEPPQLPGLRLASFYRPALEEAGVGGDGFDVFTLEKGCTALVVFDLAGKGLIAARQTAIVRNMLRYALYTGNTISESITTLNRVLSEHELLTGFATLFVGIYDHALRTITYVNCGQEPGLVWRKSSGTVEELLPTGPVLGGFITGVYTEKSVRLFPGDVLALFTDGLTEVGPNRKDLLEVAGVQDLLLDVCTSGNMQSPDAADFVVQHLIAGVDAFAQNGVRDDIALLVGVVETAPGFPPAS